ncbi:MAG: vanadium-dependent haloperoxidase [Bacteroidia bacterium]|nr:vanadium-dependent haloperoxidase [Bacteroidia bacterium]MBT8310141.1 vanadium-dependent haloperoxidase [Bacteroidia bacterium]NND10306.1 vanadium-dependent haloperoxidase [Flavobacteriaceae bacterium]NNK29016.1 vanadium-dependent haloperoxidase [Flavobacteriaceae bacterium]NNL60659.1 vanadium-dependent haloperoxidase [Flavobacteriaceae bacterium]
MKSIKTLFILTVASLSISCSDNSEPIIITPEDYHASVDNLGAVMVHDIFSPPVASRIFAYPNIAAYEIIAQNDSLYNSLQGQIPHLGSIPKADDSKKVNYELAALIAHLDLSRQLIFSEDRITSYRDSLYTIWEDKNAKEFNTSKEYGLKVANFISVWMNDDNYNQTRTMPKFSVEHGNEERWQPTPPSYMDGIEPHWSKIRSFVIDSAAQFKPVPPPEFSMDKNSAFYKELKEVYDISERITEEGDDSEEVLIAQFWDCNPYVSVTRGHLMFATKKITPGAHWIGITKIACRKDNADFAKTVYAYTKTSIGIADAFISCWDEKYRSNLVRPETLINAYFDDEWKPILQTPPFPEYTSGHSVVSGAAATVLTDIFSDNFDFIDDTETPYGLPIRPFSSFKAAAQEAAISRMYGGIHYRAAVEVGIGQGFKVGNLVNERLKMLN